MGPGRVTKFLRIDKSLNDAMLGEGLSLEDDGYVPAHITASPRVGISYASAEDQARLWRFRLEGTPSTSARQIGI